MTYKKALGDEVKGLVQLMQELEKECHKSTFSASVFGLDLKKLQEKVKQVEAVLVRMMEDNDSNCSIERVQVMKEVLIVFERKVDYFASSQVSDKDFAAKECRRLQSAFQVFDEIYRSFL